MAATALPEWASDPSSGASRTKAAEIAARLRCAHRTLLACIEEMEVVTSRPFHDGYQGARFRISQASLNRRKLFYALCSALEPAVSARDSETLRALREADKVMLGRSARHVSRWTPAEIAHDWDGYRSASKDIRLHMLSCIQREKAALFPIVDRLVG